MKITIVVIILLGLTACTLIPTTPAIPTPMPTPTNPWMGQTLPRATPLTFGVEFLTPITILQ